MKKNILKTLLLAVACLFGACQDPSGLNIGHLQCELLDAPLAIDNTTPHFSWKMTGKIEGLGIMLVGIILLLTALLVYNAPYRK